MNIQDELKDIELSDMWKAALYPAVLPLAVCCAAAVSILSIRERHIQKLPEYKQLRIRRSDKRITALVKRKKRPTLRHHRIRIMRRVL